MFCPTITDRYPILRRLLPVLLLCLPTWTPAAELFGYRETPQPDFSMFGQWVGVLERHLLEDRPADNDCSNSEFNACHLQRWREFLASIRDLPRGEQLAAVNRYANRKDYVLDIDNYGVEDYWAVVHEFLANHGDCEDYAITKLFSLKWLGWPMERMRLVILQDTNLRVPHAVLAVYQDERVLILDNQIDQVVDHHRILHYVPVYSINETGWWLHSPAG